MKRTFAILLVVAMLAAFCTVFASAGENEIIDLMPTSADAWVINGGFAATDITITVADGKSVFQGNITSGTDWPSTNATIEATTVKAEDYSLVFDFTIEGSEGNPRGALSFNSSYAFGNDVIKPALNYDHSGEDFYPDMGTFKLAIKLTELNGAKGLDWGVDWADLFDSDGNFTVTGVMVFACGGAKVTVNKLQLVPNELVEDTQSSSEKEAVDVDGDLEDNAWAEDGWVSFSDTKDGIWQSAEAPADTHLSGKYQLRKDDDNLYVAAILDVELQDVPAEKSEGNGAATNFRIWFNDGVTEGATAYTHFYDVYSKDGSVVRGYINTNVTGNAKQEFTTAAKAVISGADGKTYVEASIPLSEFNGAEDKYSIFFAVSGLYGPEGANVCLFTPEITEGESTHIDNFPYRTFEIERGIKAGEIKALGEISTEPEPVEKLPFWVTHIDPETHLEGTGEIYTETDPTGAWCYHLAFEPVKGKKTVFKLVEKTSNGEDAAALEVPEGGFVYAINQGNNWPALMADKKGDGASGAWYDDETHLNMPNYNTENVLATWAIIPGLEVGEVYTFENLDLEGKTIPTSTPDKDYWDPEYVCTCFIMKGDLEEENPNAYKEEIEGKVGDPNPDSAFTTELVSELDDDGNVTVTLTIKGMKAEDKIIGFQIPVYFDAERLEPDLSDIKDEALNCVAEDGMPGSNWENLTAAKVVEKNGESYIYFQCGTAKTDYCDENTELVATFHFTMKEGFEEAGVWTTNANTKCFIDDGLMTTVLGAGSFTVAEEEEVIEPTPTPTPTPTPSETPGDAGIIVFAILGVLAVIGAAVVIKVRK